MSVPSRVLIVRLGAMGDIVHALPLLASFRRAWPAAEADWLVDRRHAALLDLVPGLASRIVVDTRVVLGERGWAATIRRLRARRYDVVVDAQGLIKSALLARSTGASPIVGFARGHVREAAAAWAYTIAVDPSPARHVVERNLALARAAGVPEPVRLFPLQVPTPGIALRDALAALGDGFAILNPGAAWPNKRWPPDRFAALATGVHRATGLRALVLWGPGEEALARGIADASAGAAVAAPPTSLPDLVAVVARARVLVAGDTGPLHIAAALGTPVVGIFGPTDPARNGPWSPADLSVSRSARCGCVHQRRCRARSWCLDDLGVPEVERAVLARLQVARAGQHA